MNEWMDGLADGWVNGYIKISKCFNGCIYDLMDVYVIKWMYRVSMDE